jgi:spectinomycin phosphotransferase
MHEPPAGVSEDVLRVALGEHFGVDVAQVAFLPLGHDASAWVFRAEARDGEAWFVKLRVQVDNPAALLVPRHLHDHGVRNVVAPLPARSGELWGQVGPYALILYPFVAGETGMARGLTAEQWRAYGATLREIHAAPVAAELAAHMRRESFAPGGAELIPRLDALVDGGTFDEIGAALAARWRASRPVIRELLARAEELGRRLAASPPPPLLCHADIHTGNVLADAAGQIWVVDWDEAMLAPRERDLMFVMGGGISERLVGPREEAWFFEGYGPVEVDALALAYYRAAWAVSDIAAFGAEVCLRPDLGPVSRGEAARLFAGLFAPGEIVSIALRAEG